MRYDVTSAGRAKQKLFNRQGGCAAMKQRGKDEVISQLRHRDTEHKKHKSIEVEYVRRLKYGDVPLTIS